MQFRQPLFAAAAVLGMAGGFALTPSSASARVVCNEHGDCWRTRENYRYPPELHVRIYSDRYANERYRQRHWRRMHRTWHDENHEHDRGVWRDGAWVPF